MNPWCVAFARYLETSKLTRFRAAAKFRVGITTVHYWLHGAVPRRETRARIEKQTEGRVRADLADRDQRAA